MRIQNLLLLTLFSLSLIGCGSTRISSKIASSDIDVLKGESLARYSEVELQKMAQGADSILKGAALCQLKKFKEGEESLLKLLNAERKNPLFWNALAVCNLTAGVYQKAEFYLSLALGQKGTSKEVKSVLKTNQGLLFLKLRHYMAARESFSEALTLNPDATVAKFNLAHLYLKFALFKEAKIYLDELISRSPRDPDVVSAMATYYTMTAEPKKALRYFSQLSNELLAREDISNAYALALYQDGQFEKCYLALEHAQSTVIPTLRQSKEELLSLVKRKLTELRVAERKTASEGGK